MTGSLFDKAFQRGVEQGIEQGEAQAIERLLERRLARKLSGVEQSCVAAALTSNGADTLLHLVLDGQPQELETWLQRVAVDDGDQA